MALAASEFQHESWTSRRAFLFASVGAAVGLGNLWRFPYIAGQNGGAGFGLLDLGFVFLLGLPLVIAEMTLGRKGHQSAVTSMYLLVKDGGHSPFWKSIGWLSVLVPLLGLTYYAFSKPGLHMKELLHLAFKHALNWDAGPFRDDFGNFFLGYVIAQQRFLGSLGLHRAL